ncbi:MAG: hypothetical protein J6O51_04330 [Bacteroidales bacterium]|nr:hypothetical protein [Bacteroidales bacterium]
MKRISFIFLAVAAALALHSCKQVPEYYTTRVPIFRVLPPEGATDNTVTIDGKAQSVNFTVLSTEEWRAEVSGPEAFTLPLQTGGVGKTTVSMLAASNESGAVRTGKVSFYLGNELKYEFNVSQEEQFPYLDVQPADVAVGADGDVFTVTVDTNQSSWSYDLGDAKSWISESARTDNSVSFTVPENTTGSRRMAEIRFYAVEAPELMGYVTVNQAIPAVPPTDYILDVVFNDDRSATDKSSLGMTVDNSRLDADVAVKYSEKFGRYVAQFTNEKIARSGLTSGYYMIPYKTTDVFAQKLADGFSYELVFCCYNDATATQVKPFSSTQAGGTGMCFRAKTGEINFECHVGGSWKELYSGILPVKNQYYHVIGTWDKANGMCNLYVDGQLTATVNATGDFKFMDTSVDARWFGIGADPSGNDNGEASFYGEVVIARLYDNPMRAEEVKALYKLVK